MYEYNKLQVQRVREDLAETLGVKCDVEYEADPLYTKIQESELYAQNLKRHEVVKKHIEAHIRWNLKAEKTREFYIAAHYRKKMKQWMKDQSIQKPKRKSTSEVIAELINEPKRRTRSKVEEGEDDDKTAQLAPVPNMLMTEKARQAYVFRSANGLVVDPIQEETDRSFVNSWSEEEKQVFIEKLVDFSFRPEREGVKKNFYAISHFLPNKTTRDCVQFYYLHKKTPYFKQMYKKYELKNRKAYSLKHKYRRGAEDKGREQIQFAEAYAFDGEYVSTTFPCQIPSSYDWKGYFDDTEDGDKATSTKKGRA